MSDLDELAADLRDRLLAGAGDLAAPGEDAIRALVDREAAVLDAGTRAELALEDVEVLAARSARDDAGPKIAATLRVTVKQAVYLAAAGSFAREIRLLPRAAGDHRLVGPQSVDDRLTVSGR